MNEVQQLIQLLGGKAGWLASALAWIGMIRVPLKFVSGKMQAAMTRKFAEVARSGEEADRMDLEKILRARWYRWTAFGLDLVFSFKLPTHMDFLALPERGLTTEQNQTK